MGDSSSYTTNPIAVKSKILKSRRDEDERVRHETGGIMSAGTNLSLSDVPSCRCKPKQAWITSLHRLE
ncbi:hypothetical protein N7489_010395 [Penicillium chrysogenum]|uniref:Uncharacterized protein n=1 Tax=Penicillium chrysogenum TaxID=5076 RepID=A0ABQ8WTU7_PENCH|nr:uncharacterized protein N7489_010395 [Penicillium chrysogenum]XP_061070098.1 uncharacterized protein N7525_004604 [Penicillium rubens]KAJ5229687.1 hypothetical protein N7489_010395 [Penicillium chrysogenum]KAJ5259091.1 hypothetical protein N7524_010647 [Penicillium chrysogenum]KAJ5282428.1 hypothetical protein N7505_000408 [Penicillium chrysogenum]KAJ5839416.1 hypothetical protein N7525_004604 [Penicillium rubens]KAJ5867468.1 hypothetical protein N7534_002021 [Penicillium rubens]